MDFDRTQNIFIEAENLEALKILQKAYAGSVKMIYIDPPYNTGSDSFIYPDKFSETREEYVRRVGDKDADGYLKRDGVFQGAWRKNPRENGHYHSNWLSMMLPRLHLARTLLREDGVIFISINSNEVAQLKLLCDEIFGEENFIEIFIWDTKNSAKGVPPQNMVVNIHEYILCYTHSSSGKLNGELRTEESFKNPDNDPRGLWRLSNIKSTIEKPENNFSITDPETGYSFNNYWAFSKESLEKMINEKRIIFPKSSDGLPKQKEFFNEFANPYMPIKSQLGLYHSQSSLEKKNDEMMGQKVFLYRKPVELMQKLITQGCSYDDLILDFFSGSGTTAHAVMQLNAEDDGKRRYICVQLPEETDEKSEARKAGFDTIAEIAKERIRRAGKQVSGSLKEGQSVDTGFKVFKLSESNFKQWRQLENGVDLEQQLRLAIDSVAEHATPENMLYELMLRLGCKLTSPVEHKNGVYWVTDEDTGKRIALLLEAASQTLIDEVIAAAPAKVVALDKWFDGNDALKSNTVLQMKDAGIVFECV